ncbi:hypothetical protein BDN72DRAFT_850020 [Pluteus cervinus]|uniref:Uncharacterized protein n=1 Tax=Pluteus cervinus TaxID=181527 RepID=A0ACD3A5M2_9AGAR|nr:hypothetical protein BDN72DRAFT_850020 [Pluteus cervinus]
MDTRDPSHSLVVRQYDDSLAEPPFPPEIAYEIFTISCRQDLKGRMNLLLVSKRVSEWLIPIIYEILVVARLPGVNRPPLDALEKYGGHVKHILFCGISSIAAYTNEASILRLCPNVSNLALWFSTVTPFEIFNLRLNQLTIPPQSDKFENFARGLQKNLDEPKYRKWCESLTHVAWPTISRSGCQLLSEFPNLTHFLMGDWNEDVQNNMDLMVKWCKGLEVLVVLMGMTPTPDTLGPYVHDSLEGVVIEDMRVVVIQRYFVLDWIEGAKGRDDLWRVAERTVKERRRRTRLVESL